MLYIKAFHIIAMVAWFAGLFYLPRLFVYHADAHDTLSYERFQIMEQRLYYGIMWPAALLTTLLGVWLLSTNFNYYFKTGWMQAKLNLVVLLWIYHILCGHYLKNFTQNRNQKRAVYFRFFNEIPTLILIAIIILVVVKPTL